MKTIFLFLILMFSLSGCCLPKRDNSVPPYPNNVNGWKYHEEDGVGIVGEFVLRNGESTNNGEVEVKVVDLLPAESCVDLGTMEAHKRAKLQFIRMSDGKVVCEDINPEHGGGNGCGNALREFWIAGIGIKNINIKDQWVHFILTGAQKE